MPVESGLNKTARFVEAWLGIGNEHVVQHDFGLWWKLHLKDLKEWKM